ncbi:hypothetical protein SDC9_60081 [bioreactor metagenome]|uniref:Oligosaccharide 4-alpha-D-glucosyltransferase n=1 Tax=bioreactor metagenome TaxID=1076179 RepID=A0A644XC09_9ZZZZ
MFGRVRVTVLGERLFRVEQSKSGRFCDEATLAVWFRDHAPVDFQARQENGRIAVTTAAVTLLLDPDDLPASVVRFVNGKTARLDNAGNLFGTLCTLDTNGEHLRLYPSINRYDRAHIKLEPGVVSRSGAAVYDDSETILLGQDGQPKPRELAETDWYVFAFEQDYAGAVLALYSLCGKPPVLPRWSLGNWWSRYWPYSQQEYIDLMDNFADDGIPISVAVIDIDWHHIAIDKTFGITARGLNDEAHGGTDGWTGYSWNTALFPDHKALLKELHARGMHTTLNLHPAQGVRWYEDRYAAVAEKMGVDPETKLRVPFAIENERFVETYFNDLHHPLENEGVDFWWIDWQQGDTSGLGGLNPLWALNHYHFLDNKSRNGQGLILSRYAGIGSHRYPVGFSGDTHMDWEFLRYMPYFTATASNAGYTWWSHDIGGHHRGERSEELYLRWLQFGVFSPINRIHNCPSEVTAKEPWSYSLPTRLTAARWFQLRRRMVPFLYTRSVLTNETGAPLIAPMYYRWPNEQQAYESFDQYLFGDQLIVAPMVNPSEADGLASAEVWLPEGSWTDVFTHVRYSGGRSIKMLRDCGSIPVLARDGTILPLDRGLDNACTLPEELDVYVFAGNGAFTLIEHSGNQRLETRFDVRQDDGGTLRFTVESDAEETLPARAFHIWFVNIEDGELSTVIDGEPTALKTRHNRCLQAELRLMRGQSASLALKPEQRSELERVKAKLLECVIQIPQENLVKERWWRSLEACADLESLRAGVEALLIPEVWKDCMRERLLID